MLRKIHDITSLSIGFQSRGAVEPRPDGSHCLIQIRDFDESRQKLKWKEVSRIVPANVDDSSLLQQGDVIFLYKGSKNFAFAIPELSAPTLAAGYFFVLRPVGKVLPAYLAWFLNSDQAQRYFRRMATTGAHMPVVRRDDIESMPISVPDMETQKKICEIDELSQIQQSLLAELAEKKRNLATAACMKAAEQLTEIPDAI